MTLTLSGSSKTLGQIIGDRSGHLLFIMRCIFLFLIILCWAPTALADDDATAIPADIQKIFPSATRIGAEHTDIPVTPVYQLQKLSWNYIREKSGYKVLNQKELLCLLLFL